jgi:hypothetical protein
MGDTDNPYSSTGSTALSGVTTFDDTTASTSKDTGAVVIEGGLGVEKKIYAGESINTATQLVSTVAVGTAPIVVTSTTKVDNLHVARATLGDTVTVADETTDTTYFPLFATAATGDVAVKTGGGLSLNSNTGVLTATGFSGPLSGNVTGNVSGTAATVTEAAQTAITSVGTLTTLTVDNININGSAITGVSDANTTITAYTGKAVAVEGVSFDGGVVTGITSMAYVDDGLYRTINGTPTLTKTKYFTGTLNNEVREYNSTSIAHGVTASKILSLAVTAYDSDTSEYRSGGIFMTFESARYLTYKYNATNIIIVSGSYYSAQAYRIKIDYYE